MGGMNSNHGCSLWAFSSNIWSPKHFLKHCRSLTYKVALLFWRSIQPLALLIYFPSDVLQESKSSFSMPGFVIWACLGAPAWHSLMKHSVMKHHWMHSPWRREQDCSFLLWSQKFCTFFFFFVEVEQLIGKKTESEATLQWSWDVSRGGFGPVMLLSIIALCSLPKDP